MMGFAMQKRRVARGASDDGRHAADPSGRCISNLPWVVTRDTGVSTRDGRTRKNFRLSLSDSLDRRSPSLEVIALGKPKLGSSDETLACLCR